MQEIFTKIYESNTWAHVIKDGKAIPQEETKSGEGSTLVQTKKIREILPVLFLQLGIKSITDAPCGDFNWFKEISLNNIIYLGLDIVPSVIDVNIKKYQTNNRSFVTGDVTSYKFPQHDLILCRDCLVHLSVKEVRKAIENFKASKSKYLLTTTFTKATRVNDVNMITGKWQPLNLMAEPFNFPPPLLIINEGCTESNGQYEDKSLALWELKDLV